MAYAHQRLSLSVILSDFATKGELRNWELRLPAPNLRHQKEPKWISHRFPIKGGNTSSEMMLAVLSEKNALLSMLQRRNLIVPLYSDGSRAE